MSICGKYKMGEYFDGKLHVRIKRDREWRWLVVDHALLQKLESKATT